MPANYEVQCLAIQATFIAAVANPSTTQAQWDAAWNTYVASMNTLNISFNHPPFNPRKRP